MSEVGTSAAKAVVGNFISPGIGILKSWQGIVEICLRVAIMVLSLLVIITGAAVQAGIGDLLPNTSDSFDYVNPTGSAAGWLIFVGVMGLLYEIVPILQRFLNIGFLNAHIRILLIVDSIVHGVLALCLFAGAVALASYVPSWRRDRNPMFNTNAYDRVIASSEATAVFSFFEIGVLIGTIVFVLLSAFIFRWSPTLAKYEVSGGGGGGGGGGGDE